MKSMRLRNIVGVGVVSIVLAGALSIGCGSDAPDILIPSGGLTTGTAQPSASSASSATVPILPSPNTCPDGAFPADLSVNTHDGTATIFWKPEAGIAVYEIAIERRPRRGRDVYVSEVQFQVEPTGSQGDHVYTDWRIPSTRKEYYRARIRTRSVCNTYGPWSPYVTFENGDPDPFVPDVPVVVVVPVVPVVPVVDAPVAGPVVPPVVPPIPPTPGSFFVLGANVRPYALLAGAGITCTTSTVVGDIGVSPGSSITGFPGLCSVSGVTQSTAVAAIAQADLASAYASFLSQACTPISADLNGVTLTPGVYCSAPAVTNLSAALTLNGAGSYVIRFPSSFITGAGASVNLIGGASCGGVNFVVGSSATLAGSVVGNVIAQASVTMNPGASLVGRALAITAAVTMTTDTVTNAGCN